MTLVHFLTDRVDIGDPPQTAYRHRVFFPGRDVVALSEGGRVDYVPLALPDVPRLSARASCRSRSVATPSCARYA